MIPLGNNVFAIVDEIDLLPCLLACEWSLSNSGYACGFIQGRKVYLHQHIAMRMKLVIEDTVDHENRNKLDCRRQNLRPATQSEQNINTGLRVTNSSGHKNIRWTGTQWHVQVKRSKKNIHVGYYNDLHDAIKARDVFLNELN